LKAANAIMTTRQLEVERRIGFSSDDSGANVVRKLAWRRPDSWHHTATGASGKLRERQEASLPTRHARIAHLNELPDLLPTIEVSLK
jgi:hypothetical protein